MSLVIPQGSLQFSYIVFLIGPIELSKVQLKGIIQGFEKFCGFFSIDTKTLA